MKITKFNLETVKKLGNEMDEAMQQIAAKYGISISRKSAGFDANTVVLKYEAATIGEGGLIQNHEAENWPLLAPEVGLKVSDLGKVFSVANSSGKEPVKIVGIKARLGQSPIVLKGVNTGKRYSCSVDMVKLYLK